VARRRRRAHESRASVTQRRAPGAAGIQRAGAGSSARGAPPRGTNPTNNNNSPPQAFALLAAPESGIPPIDPMSALKHVARIADEACYVAGDKSLRVSTSLFFLYV
jgi:hypothetical protein